MEARQHLWRNHHVGWQPPGRIDQHGHVGHAPDAGRCQPRDRSRGVLVLGNPLHGYPLHALWRADFCDRTKDQQRPQKTLEGRKQQDPQQSATHQCTRTLAPAVQGQTSIEQEKNRTLRHLPPYAATNPTRGHLPCSRTLKERSGQRGGARKRFAPDCGREAHAVERGRHFLGAAQQGCGDDSLHWHSHVGGMQTAPEAVLLPSLGIG